MPSARFRVRQYIDPLRDHGVLVTERFTRFGQYPPARRWPRPLWAVGAVASRVPDVVASHRRDVTLLQRELLSTFVTLERWTKAPRVLDVDDAIWVHRGGRTAARLAAMCDRVICGNEYLADHFAAWCDRVEILPTAVDTDVYRPGAFRESDAGRIGWVGVSANLPHLDLCAPALESVLRRHRGVELWVVCDRPPSSPSLRHVPLRFVPWSREAERDILPSLAVGLMPLHDSAWTRGKCSFKMLQYMACGVPVVVSPVGMNRSVLNRGAIGFGATTVREWDDALETLLMDPAAAARMGQEGRAVVERDFSVRVLAPRLAAILKDTAGITARSPMHDTPDLKVGPTPEARTSRSSPRSIRST